MFLLRAVVERLFMALFGLAGIIMLVQGLATLCALLVAFAIPGRSEAAPWLNDALIRGSIIGGVLAAGGALLAAIKARSGRRGASAPDVDESLPREWVWPATIPTLLLPALAILLSRNLLLLWSDIVHALDRMGIRAELSRADNWSGLVLLPIAAALLVPFLEAVAALFLIAVPPFLLVLLIARSQRFRMNCQLLVVAQATFIVASMFGADLFARLADQLIPHVQAAGGPEAAVVLAAFARGREVLMGTVTGYAAVLAGYGLSLWVLMALHVARRVEPEVVADPDPRSPEPGIEEFARPAVPEPPRLVDRPVHDRIGPPGASASVAPDYERVSDLPRASRQEFEEALARYRARHGTVAGETGPGQGGGESTPVSEAPSAHSDP